MFFLSLFAMRVSLLAETDRIDLLRKLRAKADATGFTRRPTVFEGNASVLLDATEPSAFRADLARSGSAPVRLRAGVPMAISASADIDLRREAGANVLAVVREADAADGQQGGSPGGPAYGLLMACIASAVQSPARIDALTSCQPTMAWTRSAGDDPELDTPILRLHTETACRRGGALALRPRDLDPDQCLILLREKARRCVGSRSPLP